MNAKKDDRVKARVIRNLALFLFFFSLILRLVYLDRMPNAVVLDNINFLLNAKSIFLSGADISGTWRPHTLTPIPFEPAQSEVLQTLLVPFIGPFPFSLFTSHLPFALANSLLVTVLFLISTLFVPTGHAFAVGITAAVNPWMIFFGRTAYEAPVAALFFYLSVYLVFRHTGKRMLAAMLPLFLGFFTYMAMKVLIVPFALWTALHHPKGKQNRTYLLVYAASALVVLAAFLLTVRSVSTHGRLTDLTVLPTGSITKLVDAERRMTLENPFTRIFANKFTVSVPHVLLKYFHAFSTEFLFFFGESSPRFTIYRHGYMYPWDIVLVAIGVIALYRRYRRLFFWLVGVVIMAPVPSVINATDASYAQRSVLMFPALIVFSGTGLFAVVSFIRSLRYAKYYMAALACVFLVQIAQLLYIYFFVQPVVHAEGMTFSARVAVRYMEYATDTGSRVVAVLDGPKDLFKEYLFYTNSLTKKNIGDVNTAVLQSDYSLGPVRFLTCEELVATESGTVYIYTAQDPCPVFDAEDNILTIPQISDSGAVYAIAGDSVCTDVPLSLYVSGLSLRDFVLENLSREDFCRKFVIDYTED